MTASPRVTIITAAYNRADVLRFAIDSVLQQSHGNWQYLIIGDACTDHTASLVASYNDPRIEFTNLETNSGGQSAPHNYALARATGDYIFYLNQDDIYLPGHIADSLEFLQSSGADVIWCPVALPRPVGPDASLAQQPIVLDGVSADGAYHPELFIISSSWAMRAGAATSVGDWKSARETSLSPSQEWLFRAWKQGLVLQYHPHVSVLCIHSGVRPGSYAARTSPEHDFYFALLYREVDGPRRLMERIALTLAQQRAEQKPAGVVPGITSAAGRLLARWGIHPGALANRLRYGRQGGFIDWHRRQVMGDAAVLPLRRKLKAGLDSNSACFGSGWSGPERTHRWSIARKAQLSLRIEGGSLPGGIRIRGCPLVSQQVRFQINGQTKLEHQFAARLETVDIPLGSEFDPHTPLQLTIEVAQTARPDRLDPESTDTRELGFRLQFLQLV